MATHRLTVAQAIVGHLVAQRTELGDGTEAPLFPGVYAIFGHGNVTCLGHALQEASDDLPTWRGQNEQGMALAATAYAKAMRRRQIMVATSSIGPGATNMVTATTVQVLSEALAVCMNHGVAPETFQMAVQNNACNSKAAEMKLPAMIAGDYEPHFSLNNMFKDSQFALTLAKEAGVDIPALATTAGSMYQSIKAGHGEHDFCSIFSRFVSQQS